MKKNIVFVIVLLVGAFVLTGCGKEGEILSEVEEANNRLEYIESQLKGEESSEISELKQQLADAQIEISDLEIQVNSTSEDASYMQLKFPSDGNYYKEAYDKVTFYSDPTCTQKLSDVRFISYEIDSTQAENGLSIYCLRMDNGQICYCTEKPYLITEGKYNEMHQEK